LIGDVEVLVQTPRDGDVRGRSQIRVDSADGLPVENTRSFRALIESNHRHMHRRTIENPVAV
jgi:hypothetical protein